MNTEANAAQLALFKAGWRLDLECSTKAHGCTIWFAPGFGHTDYGMRFTKGDAVFWLNRETVKNLPEFRA